MTLVYTSNTKILVYPFKQDREDAKYYDFIWRAPLWEHSKEYHVGDVVRPNTINGYYYACVNAGVSGVIEPVWSTAEKAYDVDGTIKWQAHGWNLGLNSGDLITSNNFTASTNITISDIGEVDGVTSCKVAIGNGFVGSSFLLNNTVTISRQSGRVETLEKTIQINLLD